MFVFQIACFEKPNLAFQSQKYKSNPLGWINVLNELMELKNLKLTHFELNWSMLSTEEGEEWIIL